MKKPKENLFELCVVIGMSAFAAIFWGILVWIVLGG